MAELRRSLQHANLTSESTQSDLTLMTRENQVRFCVGHKRMHTHID